MGRRQLLRDDVWTIVEAQRSTGWIALLLTLSLLANLLLVLFVFGQSTFHGMDKQRWRKQSIHVLEWLDRMQSAKAPMSEFKRFAPEGESVFHWGPDHDDIWTVMAEEGPDGRIESILVDGLSPADFLNRMRQKGR